MKFKFKIDEKSLFYGLHNDYEKGQTATVSTPINQSKNPEKWHNDIIKLYNSHLESKNVPQELINKCLNRTTSQARSKLLYFYEFKKLYFDGIALKCNSSFGIYVKEEIDRIITNNRGQRVQNTHFGRQKLHYPISLCFKSNGYNVNNADVLDSILNQNGGFAFVVRELECDTDRKSLNFITSLVGLKGTLLSSVFKKQKGVGKKLLVDEINIEDYSDISSIYSSTTDDLHRGTGYIDFEQINSSRIENGRLGEEYVFNHILDLINNYAEDVFHTSIEFPTSPYDIEYTEGGIKKYIEVKSTSGSKEVFNMSRSEFEFMQKYKENYLLVLVTEVNSDSPKIKKFTCKQILSMRKEYPTIRFYC